MQRQPIGLVYCLFISILFAELLFAQTAPMSEAVQQHFASAQAAQQNKDYATAEREYRAVIGANPNFAEAHMNLGLVYQLQEKLEPAMTEFRRALRLKPTLTGANFFLGVDLCKSGQGTQAIPHLKVAAQAAPQSAEIWSWLATAQEMSGQLQNEVATLKRGLETQPKNVDLLYLLGRGYEKLGKEQAVSLQASAPNSAHTEQLLGASYASSSQWPTAVMHFQNALKLSPDLSGLHVELGEVFMRADKLKAANDEFEAELKLNPRNLRAIVRSGEVKLIAGDLDAALADWEKALAIDKAQTERVLGIRESGFGDAALEQLPDAAREKLKALTPRLEQKNMPASQVALMFVSMQEGVPSAVAAEIPPTISCSETELRATLDRGHVSGLSSCASGVARLPVALRTQLVPALFEAGDYEAALKLLPAASSASAGPVPNESYWRARCYEKLATAAYLQLYRADPESYRFHQLIADLESARGDDSKAVTEYRAAIALKPDVPNLHYSLGHLLWKGLIVPEARVELQAELAINPRHPGALHDLGNTYLSESQADKAKPYLEKAAAADATNPDIHRDLGTAYAQLHDNAKAEAEFKRAMPSDHDGAIHYKLGRLYQAEGRKDEAAREFAASTELNRASHETLEKQTQRRGEIEHLQ